MTFLLSAFPISISSVIKSWFSKKTSYRQNKQKNIESPRGRKQRGTRNYPLLNLLTSLRLRLSFIHEEGIKLDILWGPFQLSNPWISVISWLHYFIPSYNEWFQPQPAEKFYACVPLHNTVGSVYCEDPQGCLSLWKLRTSRGWTSSIEFANKHEDTHTDISLWRQSGCRCVSLSSISPSGSLKSARSGVWDF